MEEEPLQARRLTQGSTRGLVRDLPFPSRSTCPRPRFLGQSSAVRDARLLNSCPRATNISRNNEENVRPCWELHVNADLHFSPTWTRRNRKRKNDKTSKKIDAKTQQTQEKNLSLETSRAYFPCLHSTHTRKQTMPVRRSSRRGTTAASRSAAARKAARTRAAKKAARSRAAKKGALKRRRRR